MYVRDNGGTASGGVNTSFTLNRTITINPAGGDVFYVSRSASDSANGITWGTARSLPVCFSCANSGDEIWIQEGVRQPTLLTVHHPFVIPSGVQIYGGFNGSETSRNQRDWISNVTQLN